MSNQHRSGNNGNQRQSAQREQRPVRPTSIGELKVYMGGELVELPPFADGQRFVARLRRPSLLKLIKQGQIPNSLITMASEMFASGASALDPSDDASLRDLFDVIDVIAAASFVEPTYEELVANDIELTDEQLLALFNYTQNGVQGLQRFR